MTDTRVHLPQSARRVDFVVCIGVLPQVADPAWLWHQIQALAASGYVELPSRLWESTNRSRAFIGGEGHRWYAELQPEGWVFTQKATSLNLYPDAYFSLHELGAVQARLDESHSVLALRWEGPVSARTIRFESEAEELEEARAFKQRGLAVLRTHGRNGAGRGIWGEYTSQGLHRVPSLQSPTGIRRPANLPWGE